jgi:predicted nuclease of restriction endonuclease-like (RecB) superfamily
MLFDRVSEILDAARTFVSRSVNTTMVQAYWLIGRNIVEVEQAGATRAEYGEAVVKRLSNRLVQRYGRGFSYPSIKRMKQFYLAYPQGSALPKPPTQRELADAASAVEEKGSSPPSLWGDLKIGAALLSLFPAPLGWTHYTLLMKVKDPSARAFYEIESAREGWTTRDLERQIASLLYERLARSRDKEGVLALAREGQQVTTAASVLKDPFVLEFLDLAARPQWRERDLEQAIIDRLESFLLELGKGFCFVARQKRITLDGDHFFVDLVFYNRLLRCFVLVDLKLDKLTHQDLGQMQMYVNLFDATERADGEAPTVGIVLCSDKNDAMVRITLPKDSQVHASRYQLYLPTEEELTRELAREREAAEHQLLAAALDRAGEHDS